MTSTTEVRLPQWTVEVHRDAEALDAVGTEWDDLLSRCATATPFQTHAWLASWWRHYGRPGQLRLVLVRRDGRLVAAAALRRERRWGVAVARPLGGALADFTDVLADTNESDADGTAMDRSAVRALAGALVRQADWHLLDFPEARTGSLAGTALRAAWPGRHGSLPASVCLELPATPAPDLVASLPGHARKTVRRRVNQIERLDVRARPVPAEDCPRAVADLLALHARQWQGRAVNAAHLRPAFAGHLTDAVRAMVAAGQATLLEYTVDGRTVAANLVLRSPALAGGYLYGADPALRDRIDVSTLLVTSTLDEAHRHGCAVMSMLRGTEPYKQRWRPTEMANERVLLARPGSLPARVYTAAVRARGAALARARRHAPWLRTLRDRVTARVRRAVAR